MDNKFPGKDISTEDLLEKFPLVARSEDRQQSLVEVGGAVTFGGRNIPLIVGPNLVESRELIFEVASYAKALGATMLRGGCFKPLTFPYRSAKYFETGVKGLRWLEEAGEEFSLPVVTEAVSVSQVRDVANHADMIQIGTRNMQNYPLLVEAAQTGLPVLLKRGFGSSLRDWLGAAEYVALEGNTKVVLCERGVVAPHTHRSTSRFLLDLQVIPAAKEVTHLPVISDPSHATFWAPWVESMTLASIGAGADGVMLETHPRPSDAAVDPLQALGPEELKGCFTRASSVANALGRSLGVDFGI